MSFWPLKKENEFASLSYLLGEQMLVKIFKTGTGKGAGPVGYITNKLGLEFDELGKIRRDKAGNAITYVRDPAPVVVSGNTEITEKLIDSLDFKYKYTSGVISCAPENGFLSQKKEAELIASFEKTAFAGLERDQYSILWVRHVHQGHHELHFVVPRVELESGKSLNIAPPGYKFLFGPWRSLWNEREGWANPDDPSRARVNKKPDFEVLITANNLRSGIKAAENPREFIAEYLLAEIKRGAILNRSGIIKALTAGGLEISRQGSDYISIKVEAGAKAIRLRGAIYDENFNSSRFSAETETNDDRADDALRERARKRIGELQEEFRKAVAKRTKYNRSYYKQRKQSDQATAGANQSENRIDQFVSGNDNKKVDIDNPERLSDFLRRQLGSYAMVVENDFSERPGNKQPESNDSGTREERRESNIEQVWEQEAALCESEDKRAVSRQLHDSSNEIIEREQQEAHDEDNDMSM